MLGLFSLVFGLFSFLENNESGYTYNAKDNDQNDPDPAVVSIVAIHDHVVGEVMKAKRDEILRGLKDKYSIRQIERVTGISRGVIFKS